MKKIINRTFMLGAAVLICSATYGQTVVDKKLDAKININNEKIENLTEKIDSTGLALRYSRVDIECINKKLEVIDDCYTKQGELVSRSSEQISNQIGTGSWMLGVFSLTLVVVGFWLSCYIGKKEKQIRKLAKEVNKKEIEVSGLSETVLQQKNEVVELNRQIQSDMSGLYQQLQREETVVILNRLINIPCDIGNLNKQLMSRELIDEDYDKLVTAYNNLVANNEHNMPSTYSTFGEIYLIVFFQHFLGKAVNESVLKDAIVTCFSSGCECSFQNDLQKSTSDLMKGISDWGENEKIDILESFVKGIMSFSNDTRPIYDLLVSNFNNKDIIIKVWDKLIANGQNLNTFAMALKGNYSEDAELISKIDADIQSIAPVAPLIK